MPDSTSPSDDALRALLAEALEGAAAAEEARALAEVARDLEALGEASLESLRPDVRAAALAAWSTCTVATSATVVEAIRPAAEARVLRSRPVPALHLLRWAALLLVGLGVTLFAVLSTPEEASAGLRVGTLFRLDQAGGRHETASARRIPWGERLEANGGDVLGFRLPDGSAVVLRDGGVLRLTRADDGSAVLNLESGTACAAVEQGGEVRLAVGACRLHVLQGRAVVTADAHQLALSPTGRARLEVHGVDARVLEGPLQGRCDESGRLALMPGAPAPERFRMPSVLAADHLGRAPGRLVAARQWRIVSGDARRAGTSVRVGPRGVRLAWRPAAGVRQARTLRLRIEGSAGLEVSLAGAEAVPAERRTDLSLPAGWYERLAATGDELVLELRWTKAGARDAGFLGASFLSADELDSMNAEADSRSPRRE